MTSPLFVDWPIEQLPGLPPETCQKLQKHGILTTLDLWQQSLHPNGATTLAEKLQLPHQQILKWAAMAELTQVPGVGCQYAGILLHVGVCSMTQLAQSSADSLHQQVLRLQVRTMARDKKLSVGIVNQWILNARTAQQQHSRRRIPKTVQI